MINRTFFFTITGEHCIHIAVQNNNVDILKHLLHAGADINARVSYNNILYLFLSLFFLNIEHIDMTFVLKSRDKRKADREQRDVDLCYKKTAN